MPHLEGVIETALYADDLDAAAAFYRDVLGLSEHARDANRHIFFRAGPASMLLLFRPDTTLRGDVLPAHGARGPGHVALGIRPEALEAWRRHLGERGVAIEREVAWERGAISLYFRDPAGNLCELITPGLWGLVSGW